MKSYIQDLCGDENPVVIDCAILQCMLQDAIFDKLLSWDGKSPTVEGYRYPGTIKYVHCSFTLED